MNGKIHKANKRVQGALHKVSGPMTRDLSPFRAIREIRSLP